MAEPLLNKRITPANRHLVIEPVTSFRKTRETPSFRGAKRFYKVSSLDKLAALLQADFFQLYAFGIIY
ncbi:MAG: hypothetical protein QM676_14270 [Novosphingobium sp.]